MNMFKVLWKEEAPMKRDEKGFTLGELLIVTAIIGVLVAISIPVFSGQLEKSRKAVDLANVRSAKAAAAAEYMTDGASGTRTYYYDAAAGKVTDLDIARARVEGYGKSHSAFDPVRDGASGIPNTGKASGIVAVTISSDGTQSAEWELKGLVDVTKDNVNDFVHKQEDGTYSLEFRQGSLSYLNLTDGSVLKDVKEKDQVTSIIFGRNNLFQDEGNPLNNGHTNTGVLFGRDAESALKGYTNLEKIDFSGITIGQIDLQTLSSEAGVTKLKEIVLPDQKGLKFNIEGNWYYLDQGKRVEVWKNNGNSRVDMDLYPELKGKTIYRG